MAKIMIGSSEISRRMLLAGAAVAGSIPLLALGASPAWAKMSQAAVAYQDSPKGDRTCSGCGLFQAPGSCKTVDGAISPNGWCKIWVKKAG
ncbi:MAG TPA: high potential iron sulfur protein [Roseiarcus sp.]|nr:high potential iron sulfur protein [Roseiarcus sp.]